MMAASSPATLFWRDRGPMDWARVLPTYWGATAQPHRAALIAALRKLPRFESVAARQISQVRILPVPVSVRRRRW